jgi:hypothetical protein
MDNETIQSEGVLGSTVQMQRKPRKKWPFIVLGLLLLIVIAGGLAASSVMKWRPVANELAHKFHTQLDSEQYDEIYLGSSSEFKKASTKEEFSKLLVAVHNKLGAVEESSQSFIRVDANTSGKFVIAEFSTRFSKGKGSERFIWRIQDNKRELFGYQITSNELITN